jgi:hypothetical protein
MLKHLEEKPDILGPFEKGDLFYALCDHKGSYAYASLNFTYGDVVILHLEFERFSHNILKITIYITTPGSLQSSKKFIRFTSYFGFDNFTEHVAAYQYIGEDDG